MAVLIFKKNTHENRLLVGVHIPLLSDYNGLKT